MHLIPYRRRAIGIVVQGCPLDTTQHPRERLYADGLLIALAESRLAGARPTSEVEAREVLDFLAWAEGKTLDDLIAELAAIADLEQQLGHGIERR